MQRLPCRTEFFACLPGMVSQFSTLRQRVFGHLIPAAHSSQALQQLWGSLSPRGTSWEDGVLRRATDTPGLRFDVSQTCNVQSSLRCKVRLWILLQKTNRSVILTLSWNLKAWMHLKELSVSSLWILSSCSKRLTARKNSQSRLQTNPKMASFLKTQKKPFTQSSQPANDAKVTQKLAQRLWERIPKKPEQPFGHNWNLVTTFAFQ